MTRRWISAMAIVAGLVGGGCGLSAGGGSVGPGNEYWSAPRHFSFRVPAGWEERRSHNPFRQPSYLVRFESPEGDAAVVARGIELGSSGCDQAARAALEANGVTGISGDERFNVVAPEGEIPAWRGEFSADEGERRGHALVFCERGSAVLLEASAAKISFEKRRAQLDSILRSFSYRGEKSVAVAPVVAAPAPDYFVHVVKFRGQTLGRVAEWYTGDFDNWRKLAAPNGLTVGNAALRIGREVKIPRNLVVNSRPLPAPRPRPVAPADASRKSAAAAAAAAEPADGGTEAEKDSPAEPEEAEEELQEAPAIIGPK